MTVKQFQELDPFVNQTIDDTDELLLGVGIDATREEFRLSFGSFYDILLTRLKRDQYTVGQYIFLDVATHPYDLGYGENRADWTLVESGTTIVGAGNDGSDSTPSGSNSPVVPVQRHTHNATQSAHSHSYSRTARIQTSNVSTGLNNISIPLSGWSGWTATGRSTPYTVAVRLQSESRGTGSVAPSITVNNTGTENATLDVRGKHVKAYIWRRVA